MPPNQFHTKLRQVRTARGLTQAELALIIGRREKDIARWETKNLPQTPAVRRLAEALDAPDLVQAALDQADALYAEKRARRGRRRGT